jgi:hypothetical protein
MSKHCDIPNDVVKFLLEHKKEGTHPDRIDNLLKTSFPDFHSTFHFSICRIIDIIYTGSCGTYWRAAFGNKETGSTFFKKLERNYDPSDLGLYKIYVEYAGIYTCRLDMEEIQNSDQSFSDKELN